MGADTQDRRTGVLVEAGFQEIEFWYPVLRLREAGSAVIVLGPRDDAQVESQLGYPVIPDSTFDAGGEWAGLIVPGGAMAAKLSGNAAALRLLAEADEAGAVLGAIAEGVAVLAKAGLLKGRRVACASSLETMVRAGGAEPSSGGLAAEGRLITARSADELPGFYRAYAAALSGTPTRRAAA
ncbi:DJ-1/PfpI family protein [Muricoccus aerilatus]|uniref:DJ-1/PfpI family protein n=1 Tax=Muricoccus aerilatus TaxID=452982 RepID=UPI0006934200|nr:DJ-1/PfpI family protein [Roseomonas aerilata]